MGQNTKIQWAHHTFNPWVGCTKVSPGCDHCYAESWSKGAGSPELWKGERRRTTPANWKTPLKWNRWAAERGIRYRVFCASLADVFDNQVDPKWRDDLWSVVAQTPHLDWLLLTKRIGNALDVVTFPVSIAALPNVWLGITVVNQEEVDRDVPKLLRVQTRGPKWLSIEPMLGQITLHPEADTSYRMLSRFYGPNGFDESGSQPERDRMTGYYPRIDWVVCGGESGGKSRPMDVAWCTALRAECARTGVAFFMKQLSQASGRAFDIFESFPEHLRVREFPKPVPR